MGLWLHDRGLIAGVYPLVIGEEGVEAKSGKTVLNNLFHDETFKQLRDQLPRTAPAATWRFVRATLAAVGETLPPSWEAMSVADVMCGSARMGAGAPTSGLFLKDSYFLEGDKDKLRLFLMREFAERVRRRIDVAAAELHAAAGEAARVLAAAGLGDAAAAAGWPCWRSLLRRSRPAAPVPEAAPASAASAMSADTPPAAAIPPLLHVPPNSGTPQQRVVFDSSHGARSGAAARHSHAGTEVLDAAPA
jgi:hypothetical protein